MNLRGFSQSPRVKANFPQNFLTQPLEQSCMKNTTQVQRVSPAQPQSTAGQLALQATALLPCVNKPLCTTLFAPYFYNRFPNVNLLKKSFLVSQWNVISDFCDSKCGTYFWEVPHVKFNQTGTKFFFFLACANLAQELLLPHTSQNVILDEIHSLWRTKASCCQIAVWEALLNSFWRFLGQSETE